MLATVSSEISKILDDLMTRFGGTAEQAFEALVQYNRNMGIICAVAAAAFLIIAIVGVRFIVKASRLGASKIFAENQRANLFGFGGVTLVLTGTIGAVITLIASVARLAGPVAFTLRELVGK